MSGARDVIPDGGQVGELIRSTRDWSASGVGPPETWPASLRTLLRLLLSSRYSMWMGWGPELTFFYNDAYAKETLGKKHPWALGRPASEVWAEIWDTLSIRIQHVITTGEATWDEGLLLFLERSGFPEETYHTFSYSPAPGDDGKTGGLFCVVVEETERVIGERRLKMLGDLAAQLGTTKSTADVGLAFERCIAADPREFPFSLTYLSRDDGRTARRLARTTIDAAHPAAPETLALDGADAPWPLAELPPGDEPRIVALDPARTWPATVWGKPPTHAILVPVAHPGQSRAAGFFVGALNPYRPLDDGTRRFAELVVGQLASALGTVRAFEEERRRAEQLAELDRAKTAFFSNVSHEFRTPLTLMLGPLEDALASAGRALEGENLETAHRNALRLLKLVNALLDFSRIEAGRVQAAYEKTDLAALTAELASVFRSAVARAGLRFVVDTGGLDVPVFVDRDMWEKIVLNLLSNALKFTFEGEIAVELRRDRDAAVLVVRDTGTGVPAAEIPHLFERFHRVRGARARTHEGSGIGLALVGELVKLHAGQIRVESAEGRGTRFEVRIPTGTAHLAQDRIVERADGRAGLRGAAPYVEEALRWLAAPGSTDEPAGSSPSEPRLPAAGQASAPPSERIVLADDNADMRDYVARLLGTHWRVEAVSDGVAALEAIRRAPPALVLSDVMMPRLDGFGLLRELRADPATRTLPVILLSARAGEESTAEGLRAGANDYLVKPFAARELIARVASQLAISALQVNARKHAELGSHVGRALVTRETLAEQLAECCQAMVQLGAASARIWIHDATHEVLVLRAGAGTGAGLDLDPERASLHTSAIGRVARAGGPTIVRGPVDAAGLPAPEGAPGGRHGTFAGYPLVVAGRLVGVMALFAEGSMTDELLTALSTVADPIALGIDRDASERFRDLFIGMLGHDLRNPLNAIQVATHLIADGASESQKRTLARIGRSAKRMERMIGQLLDFTRARSGGGIPLVREPGDLRAIVEQVREELATAHPHRAIELVAEGDAAGRWDADRMAQAFSNLLGNAITYGRPDAPVVVRLEATGDRVGFSVHNFGAPIPPELLPRLFDPFRRARHAKTSETQGLGLGLFITHQIVTAHGGAISVRSSEAEGTVFHVSLPSGMEAA